MAARLFEKKRKKKGQSGSLRRTYPLPVYYTRGLYNIFARIEEMAPGRAGRNFYNIIKSTRACTARRGVGAAPGLMVVGGRTATESVNWNSVIFIGRGRQDRTSGCHEKHVPGTAVSEASVFFFFVGEIVRLHSYRLATASSPERDSPPRNQNNVSFGFAKTRTWRTAVYRPTTDRKRAAVRKHAPCRDSFIRRRRIKVYSSQTVCYLVTRAPTGKSLSRPV